MPKKTKKKKGSWLIEAIKRPGVLHRALGIPAGKKIPVRKLRKKKK